MTEREMLIEKIKDLKELSRERKFQLANPERKEAISTLSSLFKQELDDLSNILDFLSDFSSDIGAHVIASNWDVLKERKDLIYEKLCDVKFTSGLGKRLRLSLSLRILEIDPVGALRILIDVCQDIKPEQKAIPTNKDLIIISSALREINIDSLKKLPLNEGLTSRVSSIIIYMLSACFVSCQKGKSLHAAQDQLKMLRWASTYPNLIKLPEGLYKAIYNSVRRWNGEYLKKLRTEISSFHSIFKEILEPIFQTSVESSSLEFKEISIDVPSINESESSVNEPSPQIKYNALHEIERLSKYIRENQSLLENTQSELDGTKQDLDSIKIKLRNTLSDLEKLKNVLVNEQNKIKHLSEGKVSLDNNIRILSETLEDKDVKLTEAEKKYQEMVKSYEKQLDDLSERIEREKNHGLNAFRKGLGEKLRITMINLKEAEQMEMTTELGKALRSQLKNLLWILRNEGIEINGNK